MREGCSQGRNEERQAEDGKKAYSFFLFLFFFSFFFFFFFFFFSLFFFSLFFFSLSLSLSSLMAEKERQTTGNDEGERFLLIGSASLIEFLGLQSAFVVSYAPIDPRAMFTPSDKVYKTIFILFLLLLDLDSQTGRVSGQLETYLKIPGDSPLPSTTKLANLLRS